MLINSTPREDGFRMPAEFEKHRGCWMLWPYRADVWPQAARDAQAAFVEVARAIARSETVSVGVKAEYYEQARRALPDMVRVLEIASNDAWCRDIGPSFVKNDQGLARGVMWQFNAWGGLYPDTDYDRVVGQKILEIEQLDGYRADFVLEGGAIHVDGEGTAITTEECLLNPNRNPHLNKAQIEARLKAYLNVQKVIWIKRGVYEDETSGHVDNLCCFVRPAEIALTWTDDVQDPQYAISLEAYQQLSQERDAKGRPFKIHRIHQPTPIYVSEAESRAVEQVEGTYFRGAKTRLAASYINFYIANESVVVPIFDDGQDAAALATLQTLFPEREIVGIYARSILAGGGNIHCITQQEPLA